jgi:hypothetical protein
MLDLSKKALSVVNKVILELKSGALSSVDVAQLFVFCYEKPNITYLGLLEKAEKYLPTKIELTEEKLDELIEIYVSYKNLVERRLSPIAVKLYEDICIKIRLKEIVYEPCWYLPFFTKFAELDTNQYLEFQGYEEILLVSAILQKQGRIDITKVDVKTIKEFYLKNKLKAKSVSKIMFGNLQYAALSCREIRWEVMSSEELQKEKIEIEHSNLFGKDLYLAKLKNEYKVSTL